MKISFLSTFAFLATVSSALNLTSYNVSLEARAPPNPPARDRGTFILKCKDVEDSCNNICYDIFCADGPRVFRRENDKSKNNREQSGCNVDRKLGSTNTYSVCNYKVFYQYLVWPLVRTGKLNLGGESPQCDEWPPNIVRQDLFGKPGRHPNSLRCMSAYQNGEAGRRLGRFMRKNSQATKNPGKKGVDRVEGDDFFNIDFDLAGADLKRLRYCHNKDKPAGSRYCKNDGFQFHMTHLASGLNNNGNQYVGQLTEPYNYDDDNRYSLHDRTDDIKRCKLVVERTPDQGQLRYNFKVYAAGDYSCALGEEEGLVGGTGKIFHIPGLLQTLEARVPNGRPKANVFFNYDKRHAWKSKDKLPRFNNEPYCQNDPNDGFHCFMPCEFV